MPFAQAFSEPSQIYKSEHKAVNYFQKKFHIRRGGLWALYDRALVFSSRVFDSTAHLDILEIVF